MTDQIVTLFLGPPGYKESGKNIIEYVEVSLLTTFPWQCALWPEVILDIGLIT